MVLRYQRLPGSFQDKEEFTAYFTFAW